MYFHNGCFPFHLLFLTRQFSSSNIRIERIIPPTKHKIKITMEYILSSSESKSKHGLLIIEKKLVVHL